MALQNQIRRMLLLIVFAGLGLSAFDKVWAEIAPTRRAKLPAPGAGRFVCGTYPDRLQDEILTRKIHRARLAARNFVAAPARTYTAGNFVVIEDDGTLIIEPFSNPFDLDALRLHFAPNANGGYDVTSPAFFFDTDFGVNLNAGDDTNHRIDFTSGFSFRFFGTTWDHVWVRSNANVTFGGIGNPDFYDPNDVLLELPMIAALFADLNPAAGGRVLYRQAADRFVVTWDQIPEAGANNSNTVQLTLFPDGAFDVVYAGVGISVPINGEPMIVGFQSGRPGIEFVEVDLSDLPITGSDAEALFEAFQEATYFQVDEALLSQRFYSVQPDSFDQLVLITNFDLLSFEFYFAPVRNDVTGLGIPWGMVDYTGDYGSAGRLQGFISMNYVNLLPDLAIDDFWLEVMGQESEHEWGAFVNFNREGQRSDLILGRELLHWSFFLDTEGSVMEGNGWRDNGNGTFTSVRAFDNYSQLDHYLIGLRGPEEVAPFFLIEVPGATLEQRSQFPEAGVMAAGPKRWITTQDIIDIEGPRIPGSQEAPKVFRQGYMMLARRGELPSQADLDKAESFRAAWPDYFADRTDGRGIMQTQLGAELPVAAVEGNVTSASDGSIVRNLEARLLEKNYAQPVIDGGYYAFRVLGNSPAPGDLPVTVVLSAPPFKPDTSQVTLVFGATIRHDRTLSLVTAVEEQPENLPSAFKLSASYPNPFGASATALEAVIRYQLPVASEVRITIFNALGQEIRTLVNGRQAPGQKAAVWDGRNDHGQVVNSGIYFYRLKAGERVQTKKMVLMR
jgi:hypothetical protein